MGRIVAIGGGEIGLGETRAIDEWMVRRLGIPHPRLLFLPTASHDAPGYIQAVEKAFGELGCEVEALGLYGEPPGKAEIRSRILGADIVYVGGGNTQAMMLTWARCHVDEALREAYERNVVLSGLSAGSICWFLAGYSDSQFFGDMENPAFQWVRGLGLLPYLHCPHYDEPGRERFDEMMRDQPHPGIALENGAALVQWDGELFLLTSLPTARAWLFSGGDSAAGPVEKTRWPGEGSLPAPFGKGA